MSGWGSRLWVLLPGLVAFAAGVALLVTIVQAGASPGAPAAVEQASPPGRLPSPTTPTGG